LIYFESAAFKKRNATLRTIAKETKIKHPHFLNYIKNKIFAGQNFLKKLRFFLKIWILYFYFVFQSTFNR